MAIATTDQLYGLTNVNEGLATKLPNLKATTALEEALYKLLEHPEGQKAVLDLQMKYIKISEKDLAVINASEFTDTQKQDIIDYEKKKLRDFIDVNWYTDKLITELCSAANDSQAKQQAWQAIFEVILKAYYVARDDTAKFNIVRDMVDSLAVVTDAFVVEFNGKLRENLALAAQGAQAFFRVANFYGMDSQVAVCNQWHKKAENFIFSNGLEKTQELAILYNLSAGEIFRNFQLYNPDGSLNTNPFPIECIYYFKKSLDLHHEIGSTLEDTPHMRHVLMCLAHVKAEELKHRLLCSDPFTLELKDELQVNATAILKSLEQLKPYVINDGYRMGSILGSESLLYMLQGDATNAVEASRASLDYMPIEQSGQYSYALNNAADIHVFMGTILYLSTDIVEDIYKIIEDHPYAQMAKKLYDNIPFKITPYDSQEEILAIASKYLVVAIVCYLKSHQLSHGADKPERIYAAQAQKSLEKMGVDETAIESLYFDKQVQHFIKHCKILSVAPEKVTPANETEVDGQKSFTDYFSIKFLKQSFEDLQEMVASAFNFGGGPAPKP